MYCVGGAAWIRRGLTCVAILSAEVFASGFARSCSTSEPASAATPAEPASSSAKPAAFAATSSEPTPTQPAS